MKCFIDKGNKFMEIFEKYAQTKFSIIHSFFIGLDIFGKIHKTFSEDGM